MAKSPEAELEQDGTGFGDVDDTSSNDGTQDTDTDSQTEDDFEFGDDEDDTDESDDASDDSAATDEDDEDSEDSDDDEGSDDDSDSEDEAAADQPSPEEIERRRQNDEAAKRRIAEANARKDQEKAEAQQEYIDDAETPEQRSIRVLEVNAYNQQIKTNINSLTNAVDRAKAQIPELTRGTPAQKLFLSRAIDEFEAMYIVKDRNGDPTHVKSDLFSFLQTKAADMKSLSSEGATRQAKDKKSQNSRVLNPPKRAPKKVKRDEQLDAFDEVANKP